MAPLAKVGGLADVTGSLPRALRLRGADVRVAMPMHGVIDRKKLDAQHVLQSVRVPWPDAQTVDVWQTDVHGVPLYLLQNEHYFERPKVYGYDDDLDRFLFFCDALLACAPHLGFRPHVVHAQDWHAAMMLARLDADPRHVWGQCGSVYTIHNLGLQGGFDASWASAHGFAEADLAPPAGVDAESAYSAMAQGIIHADRVNTVSDTYAREILTPEFGAGLDPVLRARGDAVSGIVNGLDYDEFNPATDPAIQQQYTVDRIDQRERNKRALQHTAELPQRADALLCAAVTRLFAQKGMDLVAEAFASLLAAHEDLQLVILGTGDQSVHDALSALEAQHAGQMKVWFDFNASLGQQIYAGCDVFLMPSRYEPCGLGQLISLRYGAVPLVRRTGGLADTVEDASADLRTGTGFVFDGATAPALASAVDRALVANRNHDGWRAMQQRGMRQDWSWDRAAPKYLALYDEAVAVRSAERERQEQRA